MARAAAYAVYDGDDEIEEHLPAIERLSRDLATAARTMGPREARFLVDSYYVIQENRKRAANQVRSMDTPAKGREADFHEEPHILLTWLFTQSRILESQLKRSLDQYTQAHIMGDWMRQIVGIGPVISAGLLANLEEPRPTVGRIYAFAGIAGADQKPWLSGERRPFNARLKTICWHAGNSFMKLHNRPDCFYGKLYEKRKLFEQEMSDSGKRTETAAEWKAKLDKARKTKSETYKIYAAGRLPPSQIDGRARRYAVKIFLSHVNEVWLTRLGRPVPAPFALAHGGHVDYIPPPIPA